MGMAIIVSGVDWSGSFLGQVTPTGNVPVERLYISGHKHIIGTEQLRVLYYPVFTTQRDVVWTITEGSEYAMISNTGLLTPTAAAGVGHDVTVKVTSTDNQEVEGYSIFKVYNSGEIQYPDYIKSDGDCRLLIPGVQCVGGKLIVCGDLPTGNGYLFGSTYSSSANETRVGAYKQNSTGQFGAAVGDLGFVTSGKSAGTTVFRYEFSFSSATTAGTADGYLKIYNYYTDTLLWTSLNTRVYLDGDISVFVLGYNAGGAGTSFTVSAGTYAASKFYGLQVYDSSDVLLIDAVPALVGDTPCIYERISGEFLYNLGSGTLTAGNDE